MTVLLEDEPERRRRRRRAWRGCRTGRRRRTARRRCRGAVEQRGEDGDAERAADLAGGLVEAARGGEALAAATDSAAAVEVPVVMAPVPTPMRTPTGSQNVRKLGSLGQRERAQRAGDAEHERAGDHDGARAALGDDRPGAQRDDRGDHRARRHREAGLERRVAPHLTRNRTPTSSHGNSAAP